MHYKVFYRLFVLSISLLMPLTNLHAAPVPESAVVEISESQQIFEQAKAYHDGQGVPQDLSKAFTLYTNAAQLGNVDAKVNLGYMFFMGEGCEQNYYEARTWYSQAAAAGDADAITTLSMMDRLQLGIETAEVAEIESDYTETQTEFPDAGVPESNTAILAIEESDSIQSEDVIPDTEIGQAITPKRNAFSVPTYLFYLLAAGVCLGAGYLAVRFDLRRRKRLRRKRFKIASYVRDAEA